MARCMCSLIFAFNLFKLHEDIANNLMHMKVSVKVDFYSISYLNFYFTACLEKVCGVVEEKTY